MMSKKRGATMTGTTEGSTSLIFELRGYLVMLSSDVAKIFDVETRLPNPNIKSNNKYHPPLFPEKYAFQLTKEETESLRSSGMMSKLSRGTPWVVTRKGAIRLATIIKSPKAIMAADIFVDIFDEVISGLYNGNEQISVSNPSRLLADESYKKQINSIRGKIAQSVDDLLNTVIDKKGARTVKDELGEVADGAITHLKECLKKSKLSNDKIEAETLLIIEQTRDIYDRRQSELATATVNRERKYLEIIEKKIDIIERLLKMHHDLEPSALVKLISGYGVGDKLLPNS